MLLIAIYCLLVMLASLAGGWLSATLKFDHRRMEVALSFIAGAMLGVAFLHLIPHALMARSEAMPRPLNHGELSVLMLWLLAGFLGMFILERFVSFHVHEPPEVLEHDVAEAHAHDHAHDPKAHGARAMGPTESHTHDHHDHAHDCADSPHRPAAGYTWKGAFAGLALHSVCCGIAMAASVAGEAAHYDAAHAGHDHGPASPLRLLGLGTFLVVALHKPFDSLTLVSLMAADNRPMKQRHLVNFLFSLMVPIGAVLFYLGLGSGGANAALIGAALAFSAGMFVCISLSDLLPELQFHRHDRVKLTTALLLGLALAWGVGLLEGMGHDEHEHDAVEPMMDEHDHVHDGHDHADALMQAFPADFRLAGAADGPYHRRFETSFEHAS